MHLHAQTSIINNHNNNSNNNNDVMNNNKTCLSHRFRFQSADAEVNQRQKRYLGLVANSHVEHVEELSASLVIFRLEGSFEHGQDGEEDSGGEEEDGGSPPESEFSKQGTHCRGRQKKFIGKKFEVRNFLTGIANHN